MLLERTPGFHLLYQFDRPGLGKHHRRSAPARIKLAYNTRTDNRGWFCVRHRRTSGSPLPPFPGPYHPDRPGGNRLCSVKWAKAPFVPVFATGLVSIPTYISNQLGLWKTSVLVPYRASTLMHSLCRLPRAMRHPPAWIDEMLYQVT